jgi:DNA-binding response OmpR family regulator
MAPQGILRAMKLLVVEDEPQIASFLLKGLRAARYEVELATTGQQGLAMAQHVDVDLVVLDLRLPDLDGTEVLRRLRAASTTARST